jgi:hypothetical protein
VEEERKKRREKERKKRREKKEEQQCCCLWGSIWDGICQIFFYLLFFFPEFVYGLSHMENDPLHFKIPLIPPFSAF